MAASSKEADSIKRSANVARSQRASEGSASGLATVKSQVSQSLEHCTEETEAMKHPRDPVGTHLKITRPQYIPFFIAATERLIGTRHQVKRAADVGWRAEESSKKALFIHAGEDRPSCLRATRPSQVNQCLQLEHI